MIKIESISKRFKLYRSPADRLKEIILRRKFHTDLQALQNVSFEIADGETLGIIGQNGAGKSTLLKILTGILLPDAGSISIDGKITGLLELGTGFNYEMTGLENIHMNGALLGMTKDELDKKRQAIIDFTELGEFIFEPIKMYSSGMVMRLAFAISIHAGPKCFVVDEALSVGDAYFQQKCMSKIKEFRENGGSIIFVSHDMNAIKMLCDRAVLLNQGCIAEEGQPEAVVNSYNYYIAKLSDKSNKLTALTEKQHNYGTFEIKIVSVSIEGERSGTIILSSGENAMIKVEIESCKNVNDVNVGILIRDKYGQDIYGTNLFYYNKMFNARKGRKYLITFDVQLNVGVGKYTITTAVVKGEPPFDDYFHWSDKSVEFEIAGISGAPSVGLCKLYPVINIREL